MEGVERTVAIQAITVSPKLQVRAMVTGPNGLNLREDIVAEYAESLAQSVDMGLLAVIEELDDSALLLVDGFHRLTAMQRLGRTSVDVVVYAGTRDDGVLLACELNARRGLTYTASDKRIVAERYLDVLFRRGQNLADSEVARRLGLSRRTVERARAEVESHYDLARTRQVVRGGMTYQMEPRQPQPAAAERLDDVDRDDESAYEVVDAPIRTAPMGPARRPYAPPMTGNAPVAAGVRPAHRMQSPTGHDGAAIDRVTFAIQWTYMDADGQTRIGATLHEAMAELPPVVRAPVLRDLR